MKKSFCLLWALAASPVFAGQMGDIPPPLQHSTYVFIGGGYYSGMYQKLDADYEDGALESMGTFDLNTSNGYGQIGIGTGSRIDRFIFDHQISVIKLGGSNMFYSPHSTNKLKQNIDFGYDFMPKMDILEKLYAYGILGVHYAQFKYEKNPLIAPGIVFNNLKEQIGFNLGVGLNYQISPHFVLGVKYQHLQYNAVKIRGSSNAEHEIDAEQFKPAFNLVGADLRYYWDK
ncbi:MAG: outer membrane beta-barrel protein [Gammaproteobacteria bacterium]|nr:outer membrane beta-barrel protein [Gammaproteobacteria bacterium]